jgi:hypothetical protein
MDQTSGELGNGTVLGFMFLVKMIFEASSSATWVPLPLVYGVREGAVFAIICLTPALVSSAVLSWAIAEGDIVIKVCRDLNERSLEQERYQRSIEQEN